MPFRFCVVICNGPYWLTSVGWSGPSAYLMIQSALCFAAAGPEHPISLAHSGSSQPHWPPTSPINDFSPAAN